MLLARARLAPDTPVAPEASREAIVRFAGHSAAPACTPSPRLGEVSVTAEAGLTEGGPLW
jgi:hypothetical protein